jgi:sulfate adenylyltransferase
MGFFELLACGAFSPLEGFMSKPDYESVLDRMRLQNDVLWPLPVCLDISETLARSLETVQSVALRDPEEFLLGILHVEDLWPVDRNKEFEKVFGTADWGHPGVRALSGRLGDVTSPGGSRLSACPSTSIFCKVGRLTRGGSRDLSEARLAAGGGVSDEQLIHLPQFEMTLKAMRQAQANLLVLHSGMARPGDFDHYTRVRCLRRIQHRYPPDAFLVNLLPLAARMAGPRDALLHTIIARNYGCTHFIVGHGHANPEPMTDGRQYYGDDDAKELTTRCAGEIGIAIIPSRRWCTSPSRTSTGSPIRCRRGPRACPCPGRTSGAHPPGAQYPHVGHL